MASIVGQPIYENGLLSKATGDNTLRPGGLALTERMLTLCNLPAKSIIMDMGCGSGETIEYLQKSGFRDVIGIDRSELLLRTGITQHPNLPLTCAFGETLPIAGCQVDAILAECSLSATSNINGVLAEFQRVLRSNGRLALSDVYVRNPEGLSALTALPFNCGLRNATTHAELTAHLKAYDFEILAFEDHSEMLKHLAVQLILTYGSMNEFWDCSASVNDSMGIQDAVKKAKLGYFLLVAKKI